MKTPSQIVKTYIRPGKTKASDNSLKCRMCLSQYTDMIDIFLVESEPLTNISIIHFCIGLEISIDDGLPTRMCTECYRNLMDFFAFKRMCLASDARLKASRDAAIKEAEIPIVPIAESEPEVKVEPQDELSLVETSDMVLLETDGFHPDAPDEVFSQIGKFELEEESSGQNWDNSEEQNDATIMEEEDGTIEEEHVPADNAAEENLDSTVLLAMHASSTLLTPEKMPKPAQGSFACGTCPKQFHSACSLRRHKMIHVGPQHSCPHCQKQFAQKDSMKRHMLTHTDRRFVCAECSKVLISREGLKCHIRTHHTDRSQTNNYFKYECRKCNKRFAHASGLSRHKAIHRGIKHECNSCSKKFNDSSQLKRHQQTHLKESEGSSRVLKEYHRSRNDISEEVRPSKSEMIPVPLRTVNGKVETCEKGCSVPERNGNTANCKKDTVSVVIRKAFRTTESNEQSMVNKASKSPCNSRLFGEENPKYVILQAL